MLLNEEHRRPILIKKNLR